MTPTDTSALRALMEEAATPEPWTTGEIYGLVAPSKVDGFAFPDLRKETVRRVEANTAYIAALVNGAPDLLDELDLLRGQVARVEEVADTCAHLGMGPLERKLRKALAIPAADISGGE